MQILYCGSRFQNYPKMDCAKEYELLVDENYGSSNSESNDLIEEDEVSIITEKNVCAINKIICLIMSHRFLLKLISNNFHFTEINLTK